LYQDYAGIFPDRKLFEKAFMTITENYGCMVINNRIKISNNLKDRVFWYRAKPRTSFNVGAKKYLEYNEINYDPYYEKKQSFNINNFDKKTHYSIKLLK
jgi:hypothetical protein